MAYGGALARTEETPYTANVPLGKRFGYRCFRQIPSLRRTPLPARGTLAEEVGRRAAEESDYLFSHRGILANVVSAGASEQESTRAKGPGFGLRAREDL